MDGKSDPEEVREEYNFTPEQLRRDVRSKYGEVPPEQPPLTEVQRQELVRRSAAHRQNAGEAIPLEPASEQIRHSGKPSSVPADPPVRQPSRAASDTFARLLP